MATRRGKRQRESDRAFSSFIDDTGVVSERQPAPLLDLRERRSAALLHLPDAASSARRPAALLDLRDVVTEPRPAALLDLREDSGSEGSIHNEVLRRVKDAPVRHESPPAEGVDGHGDTEEAEVSTPKEPREFFACTYPPSNTPPPAPTTNHALPYEVQPTPAPRAATARPAFLSQTNDIIMAGKKAFEGLTTKSSCRTLTKKNCSASAKRSEPPEKRARVERRVPKSHENHLEFPQNEEEGEENLFDVPDVEKEVDVIEDMLEDELIAKARSGQTDFIVEDIDDTSWDKGLDGNSFSDGLNLRQSRIPDAAAGGGDDRSEEPPTDATNSRGQEHHDRGGDVQNRDFDTLLIEDVSDEENWGNPFFEKRDDDTDRRLERQCARVTSEFFAAGGMKGESLNAEEIELQGELIVKPRATSKAELNRSAHREVSTGKRGEKESEEESADEREDEDLDDTPAEMHSKDITSIAVKSGPHPLTHEQFAGAWGILQCFKDKAIESVTAIINSIAPSHVATASGSLAQKAKDAEKAIRAAVPLWCLTTTKKRKRKIMTRFKIPLYKVRSEEKVDSRTRVARSRVRLPSDIIALDSVTFGMGELLLNPPKTENTSGRIHFYDTDIAKNAAACHRIAPRGALADSCSGSAMQNDSHIPRPYTNRLYCQGSTLSVTLTEPTEVAHRFPVMHDNGYIDKRKHSRVTLKELLIVPQGEPVIMRKQMKDECFGSEAGTHSATAILQHCEPGDVVWPVQICAEDRAALVGNLPVRDLHTYMRSQKNQQSMERTLQAFNVYFRSGFEVEDIDDEENAPGASGTETRASKNDKRTLIFISKDRSRRSHRKRDFAVEIGHVQVRETPPDWEKGSLRPTERENPPNPYRTKGSKTLPDGKVVESRNLVFRIYMDDFNMTADGLKSAGGLYMDYPGIDHSKRSGSQSVRICGVATDQTESDAVLLAVIDDIAKLENEGFLMHTINGPIWMYATLYGLSVDYVQAAKSALSYGHAASAPCSCCTFRRGDIGGPRYCQVEGIANLHRFFNLERCESLKDRDMDPSKFAHIGVKANANVSCEDRYNAVVGDRESSKTARAKKSPLHGLRVLSECSRSKSFYDPFLDTLPGPDHCLFLGVGKAILNAIFHAFPKDMMSDLATEIKTVCAFAGLTEPYNILKKTANMKNSYISGLSVSQIASCLLAAPVALASFNLTACGEESDPQLRQEIQNVFVLSGLLSRFNEIITLAYYNPSTSLDTKEFADRRAHDVKQLGDLTVLFISEVEQLCRQTDNEQATLVAEGVQKYVDTPNLHRMLEIFTFWFPNCGCNIFHLTEIHFEKAHQLLKSYCKHVPNHEDSGYYAIDRLTNDDALKRIFVSIGAHTSGSSFFGEWDIGEYGHKCLLASRKFFCPGATANSTHLNTLITDHVRRFWMARPLSSMITTEEEEDRVREVLSLPSSNTVRKIPSAKFGFRRQQHNVLRKGSVLHGICDDELTMQFPVGYSGTRIIKTRSGIVRENAVDQPFGNSEFTMVISELWESSRIEINDAGSKGKATKIFAKGPLLRFTGEYSQEGLAIYEKGGREYWVRLDVTCTRMASFPWRRLFEDDFEIGAPYIVEEDKHDLDPDYYVVFGRSQGFPSRRG